MVRRVTVGRLAWHADVDFKSVSLALVSDHQDYDPRWPTVRYSEKSCDAQDRTMSRAASWGQCSAPVLDMAEAARRDARPQTLVQDAARLGGELSVGCTCSANGKWP